MLQHFANPFVFLTYFCTIVANAVEFFPVTWTAVLIQSVILLCVDYAVHCKNHEWRTLSIPTESVVWLILMTALVFQGMVQNGIQIAIILFAQAWWDNSWHSVSHHRPLGKPTTHTDYHAIRWGSLLIAITAIALA